MSAQNLTPERPRCSRWSAAEDKLMREFYVEAGQRMTYVLPGRSWSSIRYRAGVLGITVGRWSTWTGPMLSPRTAHLRVAA
jgi:hypothetical protein